MILRFLDSERKMLAEEMNIDVPRCGDIICLPHRDAFVVDRVERWLLPACHFAHVFLIPAVKVLKPREPNP
jgi:hypothetical protein